MTSAFDPFRLAGHPVLVTVVFDTYWRFAADRQALFMGRISGTPPPWTEDPILIAHRFTNVYRASDRVSQYLIRNVLYQGVQTGEEIFFRTLLFRLFNRIETWDALTEQLGTLTWAAFDFERYANVLDTLMESGEPIYSTAYIVPPPHLGETRKHRNHLRLVEHMMKDDAPQRIERAPTLSEVFEVLLSYPSFGSFLSYQLAIDLNYSAMIDFSEMDFVAAGPGARDGLRKCFIETGGLSDDQIIRAMAEIAPREFERRGLPFQTLWGRPLQLIDCQNLFCEIGKYARLAHPEIAGLSKRLRIKQRFVPRSGGLPQWYPPKWGIEIPQNLAGTLQPALRAVG